MRGVVDTHAHLCDEQLWGEREAILGTAQDAGVAAVVCVGYDLETSRRSLELGERNPAVGPTIGIHPTSLKNSTPEDFACIEEWAVRPEVVALGETGLDFYWDATTEVVQREAFRWHLELAARLGLPVTVHSRSAESAVIDELLDGPRVGAALHCFGGSREEARRALGAGYYIGVGGPVTFKKSTDLQELVQWLPLDRILVETDSPYLSPHPYRGKRNEPARVKLVAATIAELRGMPVPALEEVTTGNAFRLYPRLEERLARTGGRRAGEGTPSREEKLEEQRR